MRKIHYSLLNPEFMKNPVIPTLIFLLILCSFFSCDFLSDLQLSTSKLAFKASVSNGSNLPDTTLFKGTDIKSYNDSTGEVIFKDSMTIQKIVSFHKIKCYLGTDSLFTFTLTSNIMSSMVNDLVLNHNLFDGKYYFEDGYPSYIDNLGTNAIRLENKQKRAATWAQFIAQLKLEGRYIK